MSIGPWQIILVLVILTIGLLPTYIAISKKHPHKVPIILVNILGGGIFGIGWLVALVWCFVEPKEKISKSEDAASQIEKLHRLKEDGALTEVEFEDKKKILLDSI